MDYLENVQGGKNKKNTYAEKLNITLYLTSKTISLLGTSIYNFALSLFILKMTGSGASFALNVLIGMLPRIVLGPFAGVLADRMDRKKLTIAFDILSGLIVAGLLGYSEMAGFKILQIYIVSFLLSAINVFYDTSLLSSLPDLVDDRSLVKINSFTSTAGAIAGVISPIIAGVIFGMVSIYLFLILNAASFFISAALEFFINFHFNQKKDSSAIPDKKNLKNLKQEISEIISFLKQQKVICSLLKYVLIINLFLNACLSVVYPYIINTVLKMNSTYFGIFEGCYFSGMIVCSIILGSRKESRKTTKELAAQLALIGIIVIMVGLPALGLPVLNLTVVLVAYNSILLLGLGVVLVAINTPILVALQRLTPEELRGRLTGILGTLANGIAPLGIIITGLTIDRIHPFIILAVSGLVIILSAAFMYRDKKANLMQAVHGL